MMAVTAELCVVCKKEQDQAQILPMADHGDMHHHAFREWYEGADALTHSSKESGPS